MAHIGSIELDLLVLVSIGLPFVASQRVILRFVCRIRSGREHHRLVIGMHRFFAITLKIVNLAEPQPRIHAGVQIERLAFLVTALISASALSRSLYQNKRLPRV